MHLKEGWRGNPPLPSGLCMPFLLPTHTTTCCFLNCAFRPPRHPGGGSPGPALAIALHLRLLLFVFQPISFTQSN